MDVPPIRIDVVLGNGRWTSGCGDVGCEPDLIDVSAGGIVAKVSRRLGGPPDTCTGDVHPDATFGANMVRRTVKGSTTTFELLYPGSEFGHAGNVFVDATTENPNEKAALDAMLASFAWKLDQSVSLCSSPSGG